MPMCYSPVTVLANLLFLKSNFDVMKQKAGVLSWIVATDTPIFCSRAVQRSVACDIICDTFDAPNHRLL